MIKSTPWDTAAFGMPTWELMEYSPKVLQAAMKQPGHYSIKVDPLADKSLLQKHGFYYCDTLIEPHCTAMRLLSIQHPAASISKQLDPNQVLAIGHGSFQHGRFHRDFNLSSSAADLRYDNWLLQLLEADAVYGLYWQGSLAGFIAHDQHRLVLHAVKSDFRGKGLSKYWWSATCTELLQAGHPEIISSISASNIAVLNLYTSLGFTMKNPLDIYHFIAR